jgi:3-dehydroquinate synthase
MKKLTINLAANPVSYDIKFPENFERLNQELIKKINNRNYIIVTDENIYKKSPFFDLHKIAENKIFVGKAGEINKHWQTVEKILETGFENQLDRNSVIVVIGGGVYGDLAGFSASIFMRGIPFIQVPTSLLAMVDSSVGGKTGFDCQYGKNLIGAFHQPEAVFCCREFLQTLPLEEVRNGIAEMIKHGIINSENHFTNLENVARISDQNSDKFLQAIAKLIPDSIKIKKEIVEADEKEQGIRGFLNLGHTFGHAIEHLSNFKIPHGQGVAIGTFMATNYARNLGIIEDEKLVEKIRDIFANFKIDLTHPFKTSEIYQAMSMDKKKKNGVIRLILPKKIGKVIYENLEK